MAHPLEVLFQIVDREVHVVHFTLAAHPSNWKAFGSEECGDTSALFQEIDYHSRALIRLVEPNEVPSVPDYLAASVRGQRSHLLPKRRGTKLILVTPNEEPFPEARSSGGAGDGTNAFHSEPADARSGPDGDAPVCRK